MNREVLSAEGLRKSYGTRKALENVSFKISTSEIVALLGPNGAGKSTTLKILLGLRQADHGLLKVPGREKVGYVAQELSFPLHLKVIEVLKLVQAHYEKPVQLTEIIHRFQLEGFLHSLTGGLSGGEKRRLALACALLGSPELLILDEPTTGLDVESRINLWKEIQEFSRAGGAVLLSTHDLNEVSQIADRVIIIDHGQVLQEGEVASITRSLKVKTLRFRSDKPPISTHILETKFEDGFYYVLTEHAEQLLYELMGKGFTFEDLEITSASLEEAFIKIRKAHHG
ncbi:ABC transporter ATP-binding protein [Bdellovibrio sp. SKB1291214]|uniref:ABC transporter ATP-binding protein n=1 Tax=Bdellovibrio sp. SKB1291214 TaxID=1732569 RepID=UPI000B51B388|nr:ABC transporter ATP-binding protein [Bdellovibrio sp. SKB1291214]UYL07853.1 ABC transporter ATP-binding protein [Bdellovibrio sp. SKB1291214]